MERNGTERRPRHPVFDLVVGEGRNLKWLALRLGYSHQHVRNVAAGVFEPGPEFRRRCVALFGRDEAGLFHADGPTRGAAAG